MSISIVTFNIGLLTLNIFGIDFIEPSIYPDERLKASILQLKELDADIISLQEIFDNEDKSIVGNGLLDTYPYQYYSKGKRTITIKESGLMLLSKYPIQNPNFIPFHSSSFIENTFVKKGVVAAHINIPNIGEIAFLNLHATASGFLQDQNSQSVEKLREEQINQSINIANNLSKEITIVTGDFNSGPTISKVNYDLLINNGYIDAYKSACTNSCEGVTWDPLNILNQDGYYKSSPPQRVDHIFIRNNGKRKLIIKSAKIIFMDPVVEVDDNKTIPLSDHYALLVLLQIN